MDPLLRFTARTGRSVLCNRGACQQCGGRQNECGTKYEDSAEGLHGTLLVYQYAKVRPKVPTYIKQGIRRPTRQPYRTVKSSDCHQVPSASQPLPSINSP